MLTLVHITHHDSHNGWVALTEHGTSLFGPPTSFARLLPKVIDYLSVISTLSAANEAAERNSDYTQQKG